MWVYAVGIGTLLIQRYGDLARWKWREKRNKAPSTKFSLFSLLHAQSDEKEVEIKNEENEEEESESREGESKEDKEKPAKVEKTTELVLFSFPKRYSDSNFWDCVKVCISFSSSS